MPAYTVTSPSGQFSPEQRQQLATAITQVHCAVTGAPTFFVQVMFNDIPGGSYFRGGKALPESGNVYVHGRVRAGRDSATKERLLVELMEAVSRIAQIEPHLIQVYLAEIPARNIIEFGKILPVPGEEDAWWASIPDEIRSHIETPSN